MTLVQLERWLEKIFLRKRCKGTKRLTQKVIFAHLLWTFNIPGATAGYCNRENDVNVEK